MSDSNIVQIHDKDVEKAQFLKNALNWLQDW